MYESIFSLLCLDFSFFLFRLSDSDSTVLDKMVISSSSSGFSVLMAEGRRGRGGAINALCVLGPGNLDS
jgi:hypothetical protein